MLCSDLAYSNDVISVSKIGLVGKNGLVVALALEGTPGFMAGRVARWLTAVVTKALGAFGLEGKGCGSRRLNLATVES
ncbi:MAG TPA: hypothetical protein VK829_01570 [Terriglobales bacterium]|jgi:hypothetical protein|nr:hypothetical protein [Terriglobales bacterium]